MITASITIRGVAPYSQSKFVDVPKLSKETHDDFEKRTWFERVHLNDDGLPVMPAMALKKALEGAAGYLGKIPGQRNATYTKRVKSGLLITEDLPLYLDSGARVTRDDVLSDWLFLDAGGKAGQGSTRVKRRMPKIASGWRATTTVYVADDVITQDVMKDLIHNAGLFVGVGRWRPAVGGLHGRFVLDKIEWSNG